MRFIFYIFIFMFVALVVGDHLFSAPYHGSQIELYDAACAPCGAPCKD